MVWDMGLGDAYLNVLDQSFFDSLSLIQSSNTDVANLSSKVYTRNGSVSFCMAGLFTRVERKPPSGSPNWSLSGSSVSVKKEMDLYLLAAYGLHALFDLAPAYSWDGFQPLLVEFVFLS